VANTNQHYSWNFGDGTSSTNHDPWHLFAAPGVYWVCLTVTDSNAAGTCSNTKCDSVYVGIPAPPSCNAEFHFYSVPNPVSYHFFPVHNNYQNYHWDFGDGSTSNNHDSWHQFMALGNYVVCLTVTDSNSLGSCTDTWCDTISFSHFFAGNVFLQSNSSANMINVSIQNIMPPAVLFICDSQGRTVYTESNLTNGVYTVNPGSNIGNGIYFYRLTDSGSNNYYGRVSILRN
jgi:PKD repeat protein